MSRILELAAREIAQQIRGHSVLVVDQSLVISPMTYDPQPHVTPAPGKQKTTSSQSGN